MNFVNLHCHSHYSLQIGLSKPSAIAERTVKLGYKSAAITEYANVASVVPFMKAMKEACACGRQKNEHESGKGKCRVNNGCMEYKKNPIKPIIGCEFSLSTKPSQIQDKDNVKTSNMCVLAKNKNGWKSLISLTSKSNNPNNFYKKPRLDLGKFNGYQDLIAFSGHLGSDIANTIFGEKSKYTYEAKSYDEAKMLVDENWIKNSIELIGKYQDIFGKENFYLTVELLDSKNLPATKILADAMRYLSKKTGANCVASANSHYSSKEDAIDQRVIICNNMETTLSKVKDKLSQEDNVNLGRFFKSNNYHVPEYTELEGLYEANEIQNTLNIAEMCEEYDIFNKPSLPKFPCPKEMSPDEYLRELVIKGWKDIIVKDIPKEQHKEYGDRVKKELDVIKSTEGFLATYFLIVQDYCSYAKKDLGCLMSPGRGSGSGSMVSSLIGITDKVVDPIKYGLLWERFYNSGRNSPGRIALPDIDSDFPIMKRPQVKEYVRKKWGSDKVAEMITFSRMQGRGALKDVLRVHEACSFEEMNRITECIPQEAEIIDQLQLMREETGEASIIGWALENNAKELSQWCVMKEDGSLDGPLAKLFEQAIRLEGTKRSQGTHASGIIISPETLAEVCPMVYDKKSDNLMIAGLEMNDLEAMGLVKFDILSLGCLDKIMGVQELLETGEINGE